MAAAWHALRPFLTTLTNYPVLSLAARLREAANRFLVDELERAGLSDITTACGDIFSALFAGGPMTLTRWQSASAARRRRPSVMVDRLERLGYVRRMVSPKDKRALQIELTEAGKAFEPQMNAIGKKLNERLLAGFTDEEVESLSALLLRALENFESDSPAD